MLYLKTNVTSLGVLGIHHDCQQIIADNQIISKAKVEKSIQFFIAKKKSLMKLVYFRDMTWLQASKNIITIT